MRSPARRASSADRGSRDPAAGWGFREIWTGCKVSDMGVERTGDVGALPNQGE